MSPPVKLKKQQLIDPKKQKHDHLKKPASAKPTKQHSLDPKKKNPDAQHHNTNKAKQFFRHVRSVFENILGNKV